MPLGGPVSGTMRTVSAQDPPPDSRGAARDPGGAAAQKEELRQRIRRSRAARTPEQRGADAQGLAEHATYLMRSLGEAKPLLMACYLAKDVEPGTDPLIARAHGDHAAVWVPRVRGDDLEWVAYRPGTPVAIGRFGVREPEGHAIRPADLLGLDLLLVPGMAVDPAGRRLGQGGGFYDRLLATLPRNDEGGPLVVVVLHDDELVDHVPTDDWDRRVDVALTPSGLHDLG